MAVVSLMNQSRYRRPMSSSKNDRLNDADGDLWLFHHAAEAGSSRGSMAKDMDPETALSLENCCNGTTAPHRCRLQTCERITINVSGQYYELWASILHRHPTTLLGNPKKRLKYYDKKRNEVFLDRHRPTFEAIFNYYVYGGKIRRPETLTDDIFLRELDFYEIEKEVIDVYREEEGYMQETMELPEGKWKRRVWMLLEYPETSLFAYVIAITSVIITLVSIVLFCIETIPDIPDMSCVDGKPNIVEPFFILESICNIWFTLEIIIRVLACPSKFGYIKDFKNIVDITAVVPYYVSLADLGAESCDTANSGASLAFLRVVRLVRIFKLTKHSAGLQVLILTFKASMQGLMLFLVAMFVCVLLFSSAIFYAEHGRKDAQIKSIPDGFWWAVITMCTVGYGDQVPVGVIGKIIGSVCALSGVLTLAIPVPIITENFNKFYAHKTGRGRM